MSTDSLYHYPCSVRRATLTVKGNKDEFIRLSLMLDQIQAEFSEDYTLIEDIREEVDGIIRWLSD